MNPSQSEISCCSAGNAWTTERIAAVILLFLLCSVLVWKAYSPESISLSDIKFEVLDFSSGFEPVLDHSFAGSSMQIKTTAYPKGICTKANMSISCRFIPNGYSFFSTEIGIDAALPADNKASVIFQILADGALLYESPVMKSGMDPRFVRVPVRGRKELVLRTVDAGDGNEQDYGNWALCRFDYR